ncbi:hypothetical protein [Paracraurococcus lichenis]|uniref:Uncharacterized protein n=1 Tax=Paracraurococcus lichenis TaxID=3064888 RepID=A0ABT9EAJ3_9PROT|nr:hypothetical protein [Paracraurococcus sp. LOR1-02]MDO9713218.1 hypothetical protein [Paracraurococcus sp. LOR1-02]
MTETPLQPGLREAMRRIDDIGLHVVGAALASGEQDIVKALQTARQPETA